jgi:ABC-2 type transport system permease protein
MRDTLTVFSKEMREVFGNRQSFRGALLQAGISILLTGIVVPATDPTVWTVVTTAMMLYVVFPSTLAATMAADAFAGESERGTLETLLSTPLSDQSIFVGKTAAAVFFVVFISLCSILAGYATAAISGQLPSHIPLLLFAGVLGGAFAGGLLISAVAAAISVRTSVARSAQQMGSFLTFLAAGLTVTVLRRVGGGLTWPRILVADLFIMAAGIIGLAIGTRMFCRDRFLEER